jgi:hypothetical protein
MTIEPSAVRFTFGTSVRTWAADEKPPQPIIAKVFRDIGDSDEGLTPAVEQVAGAVMRRMARDEGHCATVFRPHLFNENAKAAVYSPKRTERLRRMMAILAEQPTSRIDLAAALGISDGQHFVDMFNHLCEAGLITMTRARPRTFFTITDAGREWVAENVHANQRHTEA